MLPALIIIPAFVLTVVFGILAYTEVLPDTWRWIVVIPLAIGAGAFVTRRGLLEWWYARYPPTLDEQEKAILTKILPYYAQLEQHLKIRFEQRIALFRIQKVFQMRGSEKLPGDIQLLVSAFAVQITFGLEQHKELLPKLGTIIMYPKTFITPDVNKQLHAVELNEDKSYFNCLLLAVNTLVDGVKNPKRFYHIGIYGMSQALIKEQNWQDAQLPGENIKELLAKLHVLRNFPIGYIFKYTGLYDFEAFAMCMEHFFCFPTQMRDEMPEVYHFLMKKLNQDPCNAQNPLIEVAEEV